MYKEFVDVYFEFYKSITESVDEHTGEVINGVKPKFDAAQGKAMKEIIKHCEDIAKSDPILVWKFILDEDKWCTLPEFYKMQIKVTQINKNFDCILFHFKNKFKNKKGKYQSLRDSYKL